MSPQHQRGDWTVDPASTTVTVTARMLGFNQVPLQLGVLSGVATVGDEGLAAEIRLDPSTVDSANVKRDEHLRGGAFLDVGNHPEISVTVVRQPFAAGATVNATVRAKGRQVTVPIQVSSAEVASDGATARFAAASVVDRRELGLEKVPSFLIGRRLMVSVSGTARRG